MNMNDPIASLLGGWSTELNLYSVLLRVAVSVVFAAIIGCERASKRHAAGQRTFILVSLASTVAMMLDKSFAGTSMPLISAAAVIAIAIISSNSILYSSKNQIKGLTTSVALWMCGIIGLTIGAGIACFICFILFGVFANKLVNARRINRANEDLSSTEDGEKLLKIRAYKELYSHFVG